MAGARYEKIGTIFSRTTGLLRSGAMKECDKPLWYDVYAAFPPRLEPRVDRPVPTNEIRPILYPEDRIRAKFYKTFGSPGLVDMSNERTKSLCQRFLEKYLQLERTGDLDGDEAIFDATVDSMSSLGVHLVRSPRSEQTAKVNPNEADGTFN